MGLLPPSFWNAWDSYIEWSLDLGLPGLAILSFTEAFIQPVPPEAIPPLFGGYDNNECDDAEYDPNNPIV